ncbi:unnamed protein product, partial [Tetraodon nigroviridis]
DQLGFGGRVGGPRRRCSFPGPRFLRCSFGLPVGEARSSTQQPIRASFPPSSPKGRPICLRDPERIRSGPGWVGAAAMPPTRSPFPFPRSSRSCRDICIIAAADGCAGEQRTGR